MILVSDTVKIFLEIWHFYVRFGWKDR